MVFNWRAIINFILFAMIVVAFTFAIWSYVKTNAIKNSNSPSIPTVINDNNTYVNNIASAPNVVGYSIEDSDATYNLKSTDNGTTYYVFTEFDSPGTLIFNFPSKLPDGFYITVINYGRKPFIIQRTDEIDPALPGYNIYTLSPGNFACLGVNISRFYDNNFTNPIVDVMPVYTNGILH